MLDVILISAFMYSYHRRARLARERELEQEEREFLEAMGDWEEFPEDEMP
jgi:hypothetical protein